MTLGQAAWVAAGVLGSVGIFAAAGWLGGRLDRVEVDVRRVLGEQRDAVGRWFGLACTCAGAGFGLGAGAWWMAVSLLADLHGDEFLAAMVSGTVLADLAAIRVLTGGDLGRLALRPPGRALLYALVGVPLFLAVSAGWEVALAELGVHREPQEVLEVLAGLGPAGKAAAVVGICVGAPLAEELLFRGAWFSRLEPRLGTWPTILLTGLSFGVVHLGSPWTVPVLAVLGIGLGWLRARSGSAWPGVLAHGLNNAAGVALLLAGSGR